MEELTRGKEEELLRKVANKIVNRGMAVPAIFFLEMYRPLSFVGSQLMIMLEPFVYALFNTEEYKKFAVMMERRENLERLLGAIESLDSQRRGKEIKARAESKEVKRGRCPRPRRS